MQRPREHSRPRQHFIHAAVRTISARWALLAIVAVIAAALPTAAQEPAAPGRGQTVADTLEAIQHARVVTRVLFIVAHPDDEASTLLTYLPHALGTDTTLLTLTRGEGGQNAIGPEQGAQLAILRSSELSAAMDFEGAHLYFTRATDFGFSKTLQETLDMWKDLALPDMVRVIRTLRPNIVINGWGDTRTGHGNHQASGFLTPQAVEAAADPTKFPDQIAEGLKPWRAELILNPVRGSFPPNPKEKIDYTNAWIVPADDISPVWGRSYRDISLEGYVHHRSQGVNPNLNAPFLRMPYAVRRSDSTATSGSAITARDLAQPLVALARLIPVPSESALAAADRALDQARMAAEKLDWPGTARAIAESGKQIAAIQAQLKDSHDPRAAAAQWELDQVRDRINYALSDAIAVKIISNADRNNLVAGEEFTIRAYVTHRADVPATFSKPDLMLPAGWSIAKQAEQDNSLVFTVALPATARTPHTPGDWMFPFLPPLVRVRSHAVTEGYEFDFTDSVESRQGTTSAVYNYPLRIVPPVALIVSPEQFLVVENREPKQFDVFARVHSYAVKPGKVSVGLDVPAGWKMPAPQTVDFSGQGDMLVRFAVTPPKKIPVGNYELKAYATRPAENPGEKFNISLEPLHSLPTYLWSSSSDIPVHAFEIAIPDRLRVGYIAAGTDAVPDTLRALGLDVTMLDSDALAFGDLRAYDAIVVGLRAYELRADVVAANRRLLDYAQDGGTLVVQDQLPRVWDNQNLSPYPSTVGSGPRITDENAEVKFTDPASPLLNFPNKISANDFKGWVQERGLYYWQKWDPKYRAVLTMHDPGEQDLPGGLVWANTGKGHYIYTGLSFSRQLPLGNAGAFRLFVNLLSQSRAKGK